MLVNSCLMAYYDATRILYLLITKNASRDKILANMTIKNIISNFIILLLVVLLSSCAKKAEFTFKSNNISRNKLELQKVAYIIVNNVECNFCAQFVIELLKSIPGVTHAYFEKNDGDFENDRIKLVYKPDTQLPEQEIKNILTDEGFTVKSLINNS